MLMWVSIIQNCKRIRFFGMILILYISFTSCCFWILWLFCKKNVGKFFLCHSQISLTYVFTFSMRTRYVYVYSHQTKRGFIQLMKCWHGISRISQGKIQAVTIWTVSLLVKICSVTNTNIVFRKNGLLLGQIHLPLTDRPSVKWVIKKPLMFFIWIQWKLAML